jgi:hypothetical protein
MKKLFIFLFLLPVFCFSQPASTGGYLLTRSNGAVSIGTDVNTSPLTVSNFSTSFPSPQSGTLTHIVSSGISTNARVSLDYYGSTSLGAVFQGRHAGGSAATPTKALTDYTLAGYLADGYGIDSFHNISVGGMTIKASEDFSNTSAPTYLSFYTTPSASTSVVERMRIKSDGTVQITSLGAGIPITDASGNLSVITGTASQVLRRNAGNTAYEFATIGGTGTVTDMSIVSANGFAGSVATSTSTPAVTLTTSITGILKGNGTAISAAAAGTDYQVPITAGDVTTSGGTSTIGAGKVTLAMMANMATSSLIYRRTAGTGVPEVNTLSQLKTDLAVTATDVGLGNVTNESKATMFTSPTFTGTVTLPASTSLTTPVIGVASGTSLAVTGLVTSSGTAGIGYATGAGGTVTQATSKSTGVTLNKISGQITMNGAALAAAAEVAFTLTNSTIAATDVVIVNIQSVGTAGAYLVSVGAVANGSCSITVSNASAGSLSQAIVLNFAVIKSVSN